MLELKEIASNQVFRLFIGMGYHNCITRRDPAQHPGKPWLVHRLPLSARDCPGTTGGATEFQTMIIDLTGLEIANASLDEATAAAEVTMSYGLSKSKAKAFVVAHPQTIDVANPC